MGKKSNADPRWESIEKTIKRLDRAAVILVWLTAGAICAAIGAALSGAAKMEFAAAWGFIKWAFLFYLGNVVFDSAAGAIEFWVNSEKIKAQRAAFDAACGEPHTASVSGADAVNAFIHDRN